MRSSTLISLTSLNRRGQARTPAGGASPCRGSPVTLFVRRQRGGNAKQRMSREDALCGPVRYRVTGKPTNSMICHCQTCRRVRRSASPVVAWVTPASAQFHLLQGRPSAASHACPSQCSHVLYSRHSAATYEHRDGAGFVDITTLCSLDQPWALSAATSSLVAESRRSVGAFLGDGLPTFRSRGTSPPPTRRSTGMQHVAATSSSRRAG